MKRAALVLLVVLAVAGYLWAFNGAAVVPGKGLVPSYIDGVCYDTQYTNPCPSEGAAVHRPLIITQRRSERIPDWTVPEGSVAP